EPLLNPRLEPWWRVAVVNIGEAEYRELGEEELAHLKTAALPTHAAGGGIRVRDMQPGVLRGLLHKGLAYVEVPVEAGDRFAIPPLEGFVSNKTSEAGDASADPLEALLYSVFVANSERMTVAELAAILAVDLADVQAAIGVACRLGFATRVTDQPLAAVAPALPRHGSVASDLASVASTAAATAADDGSGPDPSDPAALQQHQQSMQLAAGLLGSGGAGGGGGGVAVVLDAEATGYLMMGALSPGIRRREAEPVPVGLQPRLVAALVKLGLVSAVGVMRVMRYAPNPAHRTQPPHHHTSGPLHPHAHGGRGSHEHQDQHRQHQPHQHQPSGLAEPPASRPGSQQHQQYGEYGGPPPQHTPAVSSTPTSSSTASGTCQRVIVRGFGGGGSGGFGGFSDALAPPGAPPVLASTYFQERARLQQQQPAAAGGEVAATAAAAGAGSSSSPLLREPGSVGAVGAGSVASDDASTRGWSEQGDGGAWGGGRGGSGGGAGGGGGGSEPWLPLSVTLGVPLHSLSLCKAVCRAAEAGGFLTPEGRQAQRQAQQQLQAQLSKLLVRYSHSALDGGYGSAPGPTASGSSEPGSRQWSWDGGPSAAAPGGSAASSVAGGSGSGGGGGRLGTVLPLPALNLNFDGHSLQPIRLRDSVQGLGCLCQR
ncbi:hypothetical protein TSOC_002481, partial [Tetrabaena socialis]